MTRTADLPQLATAARRSISAAELHGAACGVAVPDPEGASAARLIDLLGADALSDSASVEAFLLATISALTAQDLRFDLLLRDDDGDAHPDIDADAAAEDLLRRGEALAQWCAAFVAGLVAGMPAPRQDPNARPTDEWRALERLGPDSQEIVRDLLAIAQLETSADADPLLSLDEREAALTELMEYVRVAVLLLLAPPALEP